MNAEMKINAMLPYFGGKRTLAPEIIRELGPHKSYWEPFCGSLAVLFGKKPSGAETVNDLNGNVVNLARVIQDDCKAPVLFERLHRTTFCEPLFREIRDILAQGRCKDDIEQAYCFFVESWMGRNGIAGTRTANTAFCVRFTSNGGDPATRFASAVDSIPAWNHRLRKVWILQRDALEMIGRIEDKDGTVIYADPPYIEEGKNYVHSFEEGDHAKLAGVLSQFTRTRVVVSYYENPQLDALYSGWTKRRLDAKRVLNHYMPADDVDDSAPEILLINGPSFEVKEPAGLFGEAS